MSIVDETKAWNKQEPKRIKEELEDNHMWINGFSAINPSDDLKIAIGDFVLMKLNETTLRDSMGISRTALLRFNKS